VNIFVGVSTFRDEAANAAHEAALFSGVIVPNFAQRCGNHVQMEGATTYGVELAAWFKDSDGNLIGIAQPLRRGSMTF